MKRIYKNLLIWPILIIAVTVGGYQLYQLYKLMTVGTAVQARRLCSGLFLSKRPASEILTQDLATNTEDPMKPTINYEERSVTSKIYGMAGRKAIYREGLGCTVIVGTTERALRSQSVDIPKPLPENPALVSWPTGDMNAWDENPPDVDQAELRKAIDLAFSEPDPERPRWTRAVIILYNGKIVAEQYAPGITSATPLIGWSMTKSVTSALIGILVGEGQLSVHEQAPIEEWRSPDDPRNGITLNHLLQMSSGLEFSEDYSKSVSPTTELLYRSYDMASYAINQPLVSKPGSQWYYSSGTTLILSKIIQRTLGTRESLQFPRIALFNKIGMRSAVISPDCSGNMVGASYMYATARDWARFGLLYLQDGVWEGERILPDGWVDYTRTPARSNGQEKGGYGAHFWLNASKDADHGKLAAPDLPSDGYYCSGHEGQSIVIVPSRRVVVVRLGMSHFELGAQWDIIKLAADVLSAISP